jgi:predicted membrane protein
MESDMREKPAITPGLVFGLLIVAVGTILFLDRQELINAHQIFRFWPLAVIGLGMARLLQPGHSERVQGAILMFIGALLQLHILGVLHLRFRELWPLALIALGGLLAWQAIEAQRNGRPGNSASFLNRWTAFGGGEIVSDAKDFQGGDLFALFGGYSVDLRGASMAGPSATIHVNAMFGGVELRVPETWSVSLRGQPIFGGYSDTTRHPKPDGETKRLIVTGLAVFGGVEVKN